MPKKPSKPSAPAKAPASNADLDILRELVKLLDSSSATSIKLGRGEASYEVSRGGTPMMMPAVEPHHQAPGHAPTHPSQAQAATVPAEAPAPKSNFIEIKSPM